MHQVGALPSSERVIAAILGLVAALGGAALGGATDHRVLHDICGPKGIYPIQPKWGCRQIGTQCRKMECGAKYWQRHICNAEIRTL
jgi:hypothetical protein